MQNGGCHPVDGCYFDGAAYAGANFQCLAANVVNDATGETPSRRTRSRRSTSVKIAFIGMTLEGTRHARRPGRGRGLELPGRGRDRQRARTRAAEAEASRRRRAPPRGRRSQTPAPGAINACDRHQRARSSADQRAARSRDRRRHQRSHAPAVQLRARRQARHERVLVRPASSPTSTSSSTRARTTCAGTSAPRSTSRRHAGRRAGPGDHRDHRQVRSRSATRSRNQEVGRSPRTSSARHGRAPRTPLGESALGDVIADAQLGATQATGLRRRSRRVHEPGRRPRRTCSSHQSGGEAAGEVTYGEAFTVQPFGNSLVTS